MVYRLESKNCSLHLPALFCIPSPVQELQFALTGSEWYTVSSPRTGISTYLLHLKNSIQNKNCSLPLPAPLDGPVAGRHRRIHIQQYYFPSLRVPVSSSLSQYPVSPSFPVKSPHPTVSLHCTTTKTASKLQHNQFCVVNRRYIELPISTDKFTLTVIYLPADAVGVSSWRH